MTYDESVVQLYPTGILVPKTVLGRKTCRWIGTSKTGGDSKLKTGEDFVPSFGLACVDDLLISSLQIQVRTNMHGKADKLL